MNPEKDAAVLSEASDTQGSRISDQSAVKTSQSKAALLLGNGVKFTSPN